MKKKRAHIYLVIVLFFLCQSVKSQSKWNEWQKGSIFLSDGEFFSGKVIYEEGLELIQFLNAEENVQSFSAFVVDSFELNFQKHTKKYVRFYWNRGFENQKKVPDFFQIKYDGTLKLLSKERKVLVTDDFSSTPLSYSANPLGNNFPMFYEETVYNYFFYDEDGLIQHMKDFRKFLSSKYPKYKKEIINSYKKSNLRNEMRRGIEVIKMLESKID